MPKKRLFRNKTENGVIRNLDNLRLYDELMPAIRAAAFAGGGAEQILKRSEILAVLKIVELIDSEKPDVALKASIEVANRSLGKPVERTLNIYGDISKLNERDVDNQILRAIEKSGATALIEAATSRALPRIRQSRKPRKSEPLKEIITIEPEQTSPKGQS